MPVEKNLDTGSLGVRVGRVGRLPGGDGRRPPDGHQVTIGTTDGQKAPGPRPERFRGVFSFVEVTAQEQQAELNNAHTHTHTPFFEEERWTWRPNYSPDQGTLQSALMDPEDAAQDDQTAPGLRLASRNGRCQMKYNIV